MIASDIMQENVITVTEDMTIEEVARLLVEKDISGVPVVDKENNLKGIITRQNILKSMIGK